MYDESGDINIKERKEEKIIKRVTLIMNLIASRC